MLDATVAGSYLALTQPAKDVNADQVAEGARRYNEHVKTPQTRRTYAETLRFFDGMEVVPPGLVQCHRWRPAPGPSASRRTCRPTAASPASDSRPLLPGDAARYVHWPGW